MKRKDTTQATACCGGGAAAASTDIREQVRHKYADIARRRSGKNTTDSCCGDSGGAHPFSGFSMVGESYRGLAGHEEDADLGLGCGLPTRLAAITPGETVVDLGSGAGNDAFVARAETGETGRVIGLDFTREMVDRARTVAESRGYTNVDFVLGDIESMPITEATADIVISNCVLNLVPDKQSAFREMFRITKPGGRFCVSDIVVDGELPAEVKSSIEAYVGCVAGAIPREQYLELLRETGFSAVRIAHEHSVVPPDNVLTGMFDAATIRAYRESGARITSVTVVGRRP